MVQRLVLLWEDGGSGSIESRILTKNKLLTLFPPL